MTMTTPPQMRPRLQALVQGLVEKTEDGEIKWEDGAHNTLEHHLTMFSLRLSLKNAISNGAQHTHAYLGIQDSNGEEFLKEEISPELFTVAKNNMQERAQHKLGQIMRELGISYPEAAAMRHIPASLQ